MTKRRIKEPTKTLNVRIPISVYKKLVKKSFKVKKYKAQIIREILERHFGHC